MVYETFVVKGKAKNINTEINFNLKKFEDNTFIQTRDDFILIDLQEENVDFLKENFEIEVYMMDDKEYGWKQINEEVLLPLFFEKKKKQVEDGIYRDLKIEETNLSEIADDPSFVRHFFNLWVDNEIPSDIFCSVLTEEQKQLLSDEYDFDCADNREKLPSQKPESDVSDDQIGKC